MGQFKELDSRLNKEVTEYELSLARGTHRLADGDFYDSESPAADHTLGGSSSSSLPEFAREERRQRVLAAALDRLRAEEEELEQSCGTSGPARVMPPVTSPEYTG